MAEAASTAGAPAGTTGAKLLERLLDMLAGAGQDVVPQFCERVESTGGEVAQSATIKLAWKPPKDDDSLPRIECSASVAAKTRIRSVMAQVDDDSAQMKLFG